MEDNFKDKINDVIKDGNLGYIDYLRKCKPPPQPIDDNDHDVELGEADQQWIDGKLHPNKNRNTEQDQDNDDNFISVREAARIHSLNNAIVKGNIISSSKLFKMYK